VSGPAAPQAGQCRCRLPGERCERRQHASCARAQVLQFVHGVAAQLGEAGDRPEAALQLFLAGAQSASEVARLELIAYEFFEQARGSGAPARRTYLSARVATSLSARVAT